MNNSKGNKLETAKMSKGLTIQFYKRTVSQVKHTQQIQIVEKLQIPSIK